MTSPFPVPRISIERALEAAALTSPTSSSHNGAEDDNSYGSAESDHTALEAKSRVVPSHESHYTNPKNLACLEGGGCLYSFVCNHREELTPYEHDMVDLVINLSAFDDETRENYVPHFEFGNGNNENNNGNSNGFSDEFTFLLARCAYLLVGVDVRRLFTNPSLLSTLEYQTSCQPAGTTIWEDYDNMQPDNFRMTKPIIPYLYSFTVQFRVSGLHQQVLEQLGRHVGTRVDGGILLERTKRTIPPKEDATKKSKSVLLYTDLGRGVFLVTHLTVILQDGLPVIVERVIDTFGPWGLGQTCETAWRTRRYMKKAMPLPMQDELALGSGDAIFLDAKTPNFTDETHGESDTDIEKFYDADAN